jgi:hypothetical protein
MTKDISELHAAVRREHLAATLAAQTVTLVEPPEPPAPLVSIMDLPMPDLDSRNTLLGDRFLCVGGSMLFVGPSGIGKSSASVQQDILWSLGREAFGIRPARPLRILTIQAENDLEDLVEMREGVCQGLGLSEADRALVRQRVFYEMENARTGPAFLAHLDQRLGMAEFDLFRGDPLLAYAGCNLNETEQIAAFLRTGLNPILSRRRVGCIFNHHTPKVINRDTSKWRSSDWMYACTGSSDITNWARAIVVIDPTYARDVFRYIAAKREKRIGWRDENDYLETIRFYCHSADGLYWRDSTPEDIESVEAAKDNKKHAGGRPSSFSRDQLLEELQILEGTPTADLKRRMDEQFGMSKTVFYDMKRTLLKQGRIIEKHGHLFRAGGSR